MKSWNAGILVLSAAGAMLLFDSCDEVFPPYTEPQNILVGELKSAIPDTVEAYFDGASQSYFVNTPMIFTLTVTNTYNDLLQGPAQIEATITANSFPEKPRTFVIQLTAGNLLAPPIFQGNLALAPGKGASFSTLWVPYAFDKKIVWEGTSSATVGDAKIYGPISFLASAQVKVFQKIQPVKTSEIAFKVIFKVHGES